MLRRRKNVPRLSTVAYRRLYVVLYHIGLKRSLFNEKPQKRNNRKVPAEYVTFPFEQINEKTRIEMNNKMAEQMIIIMKCLKKNSF